MQNRKASQEKPCEGFELPSPVLQASALDEKADIVDKKKIE